MLLASADDSSPPFLRWAIGAVTSASAAIDCTVGLVTVRSPSFSLSLSLSLCHNGIRVLKDQFLRAVAAEHAQLGHVNINGRPSAAESIQAMVQS
jgi:hypothetical protein